MQSDWAKLLSQGVQGKLKVENSQNKRYFSPAGPSSLEAKKLTTDFHFCLLSSKSRLISSSVADHLLGHPSHFPITHLQWITWIFASKLPSPVILCQAPIPGGIHWELRDHLQPAEQVEWLQIFFLPFAPPNPILQSPRHIRRSVADHLMQPLLPLSPYSSKDNGELPSGSSGTITPTSNLNRNFLEILQTSLPEK